MAWASVGSAGNTVGSITANQTAATFTVGAGGISAGEVAVLTVAVQNHQTTDGDEGAVTGVTDSGGNSWFKGAEFTNGQGVVQNGATISVWYSKISSALSSGNTISAAFSNTSSRDISIISCWRFSVGLGATVAVEATNTLAEDAATDTGALDATTPNASFLRIRATAAHPTFSFSASATTNWTAISSGSSSFLGHIAEFRVFTGTGATSNPSMSAVSTRMASVYVALREDAAAPTDTVGSASGHSTAAAIGLSNAAGAGSASGHATATGVISYTVVPQFAVTDSGGLPSYGPISVAPVADALIASSATEIAAAGFADGHSTAEGFIVATAAATGSADGHSTASAVGASNAAGTGAAEATATADGVADGRADLTGSAAGHSTATAVSAAQAASAGAADGHSTALAVSASEVAAVGLADGHSTAEAVGNAASDGSAVGLAEGHSTAVGYINAFLDGVGEAEGHSTCEGYGDALVDGVGEAAGHSTASGVGAFRRRPVKVISTRLGSLRRGTSIGGRAGATSLGSRRSSTVVGPGGSRTTIGLPRAKTEVN